MRSAILMAAALACTLGCDGGGDDEPFVQYFVQSEVLCGDLTFGHYSCPDGREAAFTCMESALASCRRASLIMRFTTIEGAPVEEYLFVEPTADGGCGITRFHDAREDSWGSMMLEQYSCDSIIWTEGGQCPHPAATDCL